MRKSYRQIIVEDGNKSSKIALGGPSACTGYRGQKPCCNNISGCALWDAKRVCQISTSSSAQLCSLSSSSSFSSSASSSLSSLYMRRSDLGKSVNHIYTNTSKRLVFLGNSIDDVSGFPWAIT
jgi:hypothetical protein